MSNDKKKSSAKIYEELLKQGVFSRDISFNKGGPVTWGKEIHTMRGKKADQVIMDDLFPEVKGEAGAEFFSSLDLIKEIKQKVYQSMRVPREYMNGKAECSKCGGQGGRYEVEEYFSLQENSIPDDGRVERRWVDCPRCGVKDKDKIWIYQLGSRVGYVDNRMRYGSRCLEHSGLGWFSQYNEFILEGTVMSDELEAIVEVFWDEEED